MSTIHGGQGSIITQGLVLRLDAANPRSYEPPYTSTAWKDISGNGNNGTLTNGPTFNSADRGSIVFDGTNDYVEVNPFSFLSNYSISVWVNPTNIVTDSYYNIISSGCIFESNTNFSLSFRNRLGSSNRICLYVKSTTTQGFEVILTESPLNVWNNFLVTKNGTSYQFYQNGMLIFSGTNTTLPTNGNQPLTIGKPNIVQRTEVRYIGRISDTLIYNRALSSSEVLQNFNATRARFGI